MMSLYLDIAALAVTIVLAVLGAMSGLIREVFRLAGMIAGFFIAFMFFRDLQAVVERALPVTPSAAAAAIGFIVIFVASFLAITGVGVLLKKFTDLITLGWIDSVLGAVFGALKVGIVVWAVCLSISSFPDDVVEERFGKSVVYGIFKALPQNVFGLDGLEKLRDWVRGRGNNGEQSEPNENEPVSGVIEV